MGLREAPQRSVCPHTQSAQKFPQGCKRFSHENECRYSMDFFVSPTCTLSSGCIATGSIQTKRLWMVFYRLNLLHADATSYWFEGLSWLLRSTNDDDIEWMFTTNCGWRKFRVSVLRAYLCLRIWYTAGVRMLSPGNVGVFSVSSLGTSTFFGTMGAFVSPLFARKNVDDNICVFGVAEDDVSSCSSLSSLGFSSCFVTMIISKKSNPYILLSLVSTWTCVSLRTQILFDVISIIVNFYIR